MAQELYTVTVSCLRLEGSLSQWFEIKSGVRGVRQGCTIAPSLFLTPMDWILERTVHKGLAGATYMYGGEVFSDLDYTLMMLHCSPRCSKYLSCLCVLCRRRRVLLVLRSIGVRPNSRQQWTPYPPSRSR